MVATLDMSVMTDANVCSFCNILEIPSSSQGDDLRLGIFGTREEKNYWNNKTWLNSYDFDDENYWNSKLPFDCLLNHLRTVKISGFVLNTYLLLLGHSCMLEKMVIWTGQSTHQGHHFSSDLLELHQKLSRFPRASDHVVILFSRVFFLVRHTVQLAKSFSCVVKCKRAWSLEHFLLGHDLR